MTGRHADPRAELDERVDAIESAYEYFLAYAAQGRASDRGAGEGHSELRERLVSMQEALTGLADVVRALAAARNPDGAGAFEAFFAAIEDDARKVRAAVRLVLASADIGSQLVDNLNASIHVRAILTDLFVVDEALR